MLRKQGEGVTSAHFSLPMPSRTQHPCWAFPVHQRKRGVSRWCTRRPGRCAKCVPAVEVRRDLVNHCRGLNAGNELHRPAAMLTGLDVDPEYGFETFSPCHGSALFGRTGVSLGAGLAAPGRCDARPPTAVWGKDAVETGQIDPRPWYQCSQPGDEIERFENHMGRAVTPGRL